MAIYFLLSLWDSSSLNRPASFELATKSKMLLGRFEFTFCLGYVSISSSKQ